jgi:hypothetical protein
MPLGHAADTSALRLLLTQSGQSGMDSSVVELDQALGRRQRRMVGMKWDWKMIFPPEKARP